MRKSLAALFFSMLVGALLCIVLSGCENFLTGSNLKEDLERYIAWANAPKVTVKIRTDSSDYGNIYPESVTVAKGDTFTVEFIQNPNTIFKYWTFTNPTTGQELGDDVVSILEEKTTEDPVEKTTTRKLTLTLNSLPPDIEIRPKCYLKTESTPPEFKKLNIAKNEQNAKSGTDLITFDNFVHYADNVNFGGDSNKVKANIQNHHVNCLWFDLEAYDANSGVDMMEVQEQLLRNKKGTEVIKTEPYITRYQLKSENHNLSISKTLKYDFKISDDGVVNIKIILYDNSGNKTIKSFDVIKDTICEMRCSFSQKKEYNNVEDYLAGSNNIYSIPFSFSIPIDNNNNAFDDCDIYIQDLNGNQYKDSDPFLFQHMDKTVNGVMIYNVSAEVISQYVNILDQIKPYFKIQTSYDNGAFTDYPLNTLGFTLDSFYYYGDYCDCCPSSDVSLSADDLRETIIRALIIDDAGNEWSWNTVISKSVWLTHVEMNNEEKSFMFFWDKAMGECRPFIVYKSPDGTVENYSLCENASDGTTFKDNNGLYFNNDGSLKTGTYYFYLLKEYSTFKFTHGIKPWILDNTSGTSSLVNLEDCTIPSFTCEADAPVLSKGTRTVRINFEKSFTPDNAVTYFMEYSGGDLSAPSLNLITDFSKTLVLEVPTSKSDNDYVFNVKISYRGKSRKDDTKEKTLSLNYDNCPPSIEYGADVPLYTTIVLPDRRIIYLEKSKKVGSHERYFDNSGLDADDINDEYMTIKYFYSNMPDLAQRGIDWTDKHLIKQYKQPYSNQRLELPFDGSSGNYCYVLLKDKNGNTTDYRFDLVTTYYKVRQDIEGFNTSPAVDTSANLRWKEKKYDGEYGNWNVTNYYLKDGKWKLTQQSENSFDSSLWMTQGFESTVNSIPYITDQEKEKYWNVKVKVELRTAGNDDYYDYDYPISLRAEEPTCFNKMYIWGCKGKSNYVKSIDYGYYMDVMYWHPGYRNNPQNYPCKEKYFIEGALGISLFIDSDCLVHTYYCENDMGTIQNWLNSGTEVKVIEKRTDFTYEVPLEEIPSGKYYTTIIHYADESIQKTSTQYKK